MHFAAYAQGHRMPGYVHRAARQLQQCRTAAMGGHIQACPHGHVERKIFHSCRHRLCPQCNAVPREQWLLRMRERLIRCAHHHLIFTIPHELHPLWRWNRAWCTQGLFDCVADTLRSLTADARYLGAQSGFICTLHTWGRSLSFHPHIHCLISDGGLDSRGEWARPRKSCFLPMRVVMALFRGKLLAKLREAIERGELRVPPDTTMQRCLNLLNRLGRLKWNVHLRERYAHGEGVMIYLARYLKGGALRNTQLTQLDERCVGFRYQPHGHPEASTLMLKPEVFMARYLQHTPLPHVPLVRHYGLYATCNSQRLDLARHLHQQLALTRQSATLRCAEYFERCIAQNATPMRCPECQCLLIVREHFARQQAPPCARS